MHRMQCIECNDHLRPSNAILEHPAQVLHTLELILKLWLRKEEQTNKLLKLLVTAHKLTFTNCLIGKIGEGTKNRQVQYVKPYVFTQHATVRQMTLRKQHKFGQRPSLTMI